MSQNSVLVTGGAGFVGSHVGERLLRLGHQVVCLDNFDDFYAPDIKWNNIQSYLTNGHFTLVQGDIRDRGLLRRLFSNHVFGSVIHLAAKAGVRSSIDQPQLYQEVNVQGTINLLEECRAAAVEKFVFASSSSVYGVNAEVPFREDQRIDCPMSPYAASKAAAELFCHTYHHLYGLPIVILRLFTVYGPRQRPQMAIHLFTRMIDLGEEISIFGDGMSRRDYTSVSDIVDGILQALTWRGQDFEIFNLGNSRPVALEYLIHLIEDALGKRARTKRLPMQPGDVPITFAEISKAERLLGYQPKTRIEEDIPSFVQWYRKFADVVRCSST
jgi:UDP-glucuronate 4-epimerase